VSFASTTATTCSVSTVDTVTTVTLVAAGRCAIEATQAGDAYQTAGQLAMCPVPLFLLRAAGDQLLFPVLIRHLLEYKYPGMWNVELGQYLATVGSPFRPVLQVQRKHLLSQNVAGSKSDLLPSNLRLSYCLFPR
jgi:hypothetical protein